MTRAPKKKRNPGKPPRGVAVEEVTPPLGGVRDVGDAIRDAPVLEPLAGDPEPPPPPPPTSRKDEERAQDCPIKPLGRYRGMYHYLTRAGEVLSLAKGRHTKAEIRGLFEGSLAWCYAEYPVTKGAGEDEKVVGWNADSVGNWMMRMCAARGFFEPQEQIRGCGVWRGDGGGLNVHCGNRVWFNGRWKPAGEEEGKLIYVAMPKLEPPDFDKPMTGDEAAEYFHFLGGAWNWQDPALARLFLGWQGCAVVSGALEWRPHVHVTGSWGSGKTWLQDLTAGMIGGLIKASEPTPASIYQLLGPTNGAVTMDEVEPTVRGDLYDRVMKLVRMGSSYRQAPITRGTATGEDVKKYYVRAIFYLTSILYPEPRPQDRSRVSFLRLKDLPEGVDTDTINDEIKRFITLAPRFRGRMILGWERFNQNLVAISSALGRDRRTIRYADQVGALLAASETLLFDEPLDTDAADGLAAEISKAVSDDTEPDWAQCLRHLLSHPIREPHDFENAATIGLLVELSLHPGDRRADARKYLRSLGIAFDPDTGDAGWVVLGMGHQGLERVFTDSRWRDGGWRSSLEGLDGMVKPRKQASFKGAKCWIMKLPVAEFRDIPEEEAEPPPPVAPSGPAPPGPPF